MSKEEIIAYFSAQANGVHRYNNEEFFEREAQEKIFHIGAAKDILDFGCGTGDLLAYFAKQYVTVVGADISEPSVVRARERLAQFGAENAEVFCADENTLWQHLNGRHFDAIVSAAVMQYLSESQLGALLRNAHAYLAPAGRIIMFDVIDPRLYWVVKYGWFRDGPVNLGYVLGGANRSLRILLRKFVRGIAGKPEDYMGRAHFPNTLERVAKEEGFSFTVIRSMYYEYRYHALMQVCG